MLHVQSNMNRFIRMILIQAAASYAFKHGSIVAKRVWRNKVLKMKAEKGESYFDVSKTRLFALLSDYIRFKDNVFNVVDVKAAVQLNKLPFPEVNLHDLLWVCELIGYHDATGFGYFTVPNWVKTKIEDVIGFIEAVQRQKAA